MLWNLKEGDNIPADGLFLSGSNMQADEAALTGEPKLLAKSDDSPFLLSGWSILFHNL